MLNCALGPEAAFEQARAWCEQEAAGDPARRRFSRGEAMDLRTYGIGAQILRNLGVGRMRLLAHPRRMPSMAGFGLEVTGFAEDDEAGERAEGPDEAAPRSVVHEIDTIGRH